MVPVSSLRLVALIVLTVLAAVTDTLAAETKAIRLRNETIVTPPQARPLAPQRAEAPASGLFLIQFDRPPSQALRAELADRGAHLLRYIPDDAFIARLHQAPLHELRALPGVRWIGEYRPDHKVAAILRRWAALGSDLDIRLAVAPDVPPAELIALRKQLQRLERESASTFGRILQGRVSPTQLALIARSPVVLWIEPAPRMRLFDAISSKIVGGGSYETGEPGDDFPFPGDWDDDFGFAPNASPRPRQHSLPNSQHLTLTQQLGFDGSGVVVAVPDSGLDLGDPDLIHPDLAGRADAFFFYGSLEDASDEHGHGTHVAGIIAGSGATGETDAYGNLYGLGVAPGARIVAQRMFDGIGNYEPPPSFETLTRDAVRAGADIGSNSWGDTTYGRYDLTAAEFDALVRDADALAAGDQPFILEFSAGNSGPGTQTIGTPAVAKNVIATGASQNDRYGFYIFEDGPEAMADFSSRGPCEDGRIKPDVVAPGTWIASLQSGAATGENAWAPISPNYQFQGGTSQSGPHVSGAAAVFVQYWRETRNGLTPSPALVKAALINSSVDLDDGWGTRSIPNMDEGWGRVTLTNLIGSSRHFDFIDQSVALTNGQVFERRILVGNPRVPLKITLTYTDVPALPAALQALVNDLDLEVEAPDGTWFRGNAFDAGESIPNAFAADSINNVEGVHLANPMAGEYIVRIRGSRVVEDVFRRANAEPLQDFALVITGDLPLPGHGIIALHRPAYTVPDTLQLRLIDADLRGDSSVEVRVVSDTEPLGEAVLLLASGNAGLFTGAVATATGPAIPDGRLQIAHGDTIEAIYLDASPEARRTSDALADLLPPNLTGVADATRFGRLNITWETDEPANAIVEFGATPALGSFVTNRAFVTSHRVVLDGFAPEQSVYYRVRSRDAAGNEGLADAAGIPFETSLAASARILVIDQYDPTFTFFNLPLFAYTSALDDLGLDYEVWDVANEERTPDFEDLRGYSIVMWRLSEFFPALTVSGIRALREYVDAGGGLFVSSMELLSRLDEAGMDNFRRQVLRVESYDVDPGIDGIYGNDNLSMTSEIETELDFSEFPDLIIIPSDLSDTFRATTNATPILFDAWTGRTVGVRHPATATGTDSASGRVVFFSFPLEAIPDFGDAPNTRAGILYRVLSFLAPGVVDRAVLELDREQYTLPALVTVEVSDPDLAGQTSLEVSAQTPLESVPHTLELLATPRPGLFRGTFRLVPETTPPAAGLLRARNGDRLEVSYRDARPQQTLTVRATIDTEPPEIADIEIEPDYTEAIVRWTTSEPTDGLVRYRDVAFPSNLTAYHPDYTFVHELRLVGLEPDRDYTFEIVCRDPAGNVRTDNKQGQFHRFRTRKPLTPPFIDNLDAGGGEWTVASSDLGAEVLSIFITSTWELGRPNNELATSAWSGLHCWGTNLRGLPNELADTSLISPAILLTGGNRATLRFTHNYDFYPRSDFGDILEVGGLYATTNNGAIWTPLRQYSTASDGWEQVEVDLSPFLGHIVRLGWAYGLLAIDSVPHPGWLVDDIAVTVSSYVPATLILSNNLHQAAVTLRGPINRIERGRLVTLTNAPPGEYLFEFGSVPYYETPLAQSHLLSEGSTLLVAGHYTFPDINSNGISDLWEQHFFGEIAPGHRPEDDRDLDGFSDLAEFLAGTNPTNATSRLRLHPPQATVTGDVLLRWDSAAGVGYRVQGSPDALAWTPVTDWIRGTGTATTAIVPNPATDLPYLFRIEAHP
ncbi:MAG: S8 family serine peptidase [Verrucomicrobiae bacterium]|nr:S8 family serine peptidase [Verrucomicrobiae bacterium]